MGDEKTPMVLMDEPEDGYCELQGWVEATVEIDAARGLLAPFCLGPDGNPPALPIGEPARVWLAPSDPQAHVDDQRWTACEPGAAGAREFWAFDTTEAEVAPRG